MELRKIVFFEEEVRAAAVNHCMHANINVPQANIESVAVSNDAAKTLVLRFSVASPLDKNTVTLNREHVVAALIRYCRDQKIPLPRTGQKVVQAADDNALALLINNRWTAKR